MPRGYPNDPITASPKGGYHIVTKEDLRSRIKEIEARIKQMDRRDKALGELKKWLANRKLTLADMMWMYRQMQPKRADAPVRSKKPLQPTAKRASPGPGYMFKNGKLIAPKGDPEFRRRIAEARKAKGWASTDVGKKIGVSHATVTSWEAGRYIPKEELRVKILKILDLPASLGAEATETMMASMGGPHNKKKNGAAAVAE